MKQSAAKTLGVAALGAAFAAAGAGAATAAPSVPDALPALDTVTQALPAENLSALPGPEQAAETGLQAAGAGVTAVQPVVEQRLADGPTQPVAGLLGGLPLQGSVNGFPVG
ncbi:ATP-binding protein [Streptomyces sp. KMM 9044]|uniref:ATP-binding protein n=1 Tax=Streptomyces sp. KMM 9044 TaxID=2744474 RepID=UPI002150F5FC|nr:ATP-binding protein [Streptomyces sp. KMM 9044]WAX78297.1 ATP-binding protein [Streptomyces sp. KMM 9044]